MICLYKNNVAAGVREALRSAFVDQSLPPSELIAVFDGPVPSEVVSVIDEFESQFSIRRVVFPENRGHGPARAAAIDACEKHWIAIIDADDISRADRFEHLVALASKHPDSAVIGGGFTEFRLTENGIEEGPDVFLPRLRTK